MLVLAALSWGIATALTKVALQQLAPLDLLSIEITVGALSMCAIALARGARPTGPMLVIALMGAIDPGLSFLLFDVGIARTAATNAALLVATETLFTAALAAMFLRERLDARLAIALAAGSLGAVVVSLHSGGGGSNSLLGDLLCLGGALGAATYGVLARRFAPGREVLSLTAVQMLGAVVVCLPLGALGAAAGRSHLAHVDAGHLVAAVAVGVLATTIPFLLFNVAIERVTAMTAGLMLSLIPFFGTVSAVAMLSESLAAVQLLGGVLIVAAATLAALSAQPETASVAAG